VSCSSYVCPVLPSSDLHLEFYVASFCSGSWLWARVVLGCVLEVVEGRVRLLVAGAPVAVVSRIVK
jgi:hypothetical protein